MLQIGREIYIRGSINTGSCYLLAQDTVYIYYYFYTLDTCLKAPPDLRFLP